jgi:ATP-dependent helicase HrpB
VSFNYLSIDLPVVEIIPQLQVALATNDVVVLSAPTGAGKSTLLPLALLHETWLQGKKIIVLEPRRLAAKTIAYRMAQLLGEEVGNTIGYRIKMETRVSKNTRLEVITEGILTKMLQSDPELSDIGLILFDEFHERSLHADLALALCRDAQKIVRSDLKMVIMSATLNIADLSTLLQAPIVESKGRQFPVSINYSGDTELSTLAEMVCKQVVEVYEKHEGDVLVFLPGEGDIHKCTALLSQSSRLKGCKLHPLFGMLPMNKQMAALMPDREGNRKIVLATSIAETSLTIEGITVVVDSGFGKTQRFDPKSGLSRLETIQISNDVADQRTGRAGRLTSGHCYRMWSKAKQARIKEHRTPEILEADLSSLVLDLYLWGTKNPNELIWLNPPPIGALQAAEETLENLEAIVDKKVTEHGKAIHNLPCHPRIAHMLIKADEFGLAHLATDIAALLEERDPLREAGADITQRIELLRKYREENRLGKGFTKIEKNAGYYRSLLNLETENDHFDATEAGLLISFAYPERIAGARPGNNAQFQLANGRLAMIGHKDNLAHEPWLAVAHADARDGMGKIHLAAPLNPKDLASLVKTVDNVSWDTKKGGLIAATEMRIGSIVLSSRPLQQFDKNQKLKAICQALKKEGENLLDFNEKTIQLQNRMASLSIWNPAEKWPDFSTQTLLLTTEIWLSPYLDSIKKNEDLKKLDLYTILLNALSWEQQQSLSELAPEKIEVPSGSKIPLFYHPNGQTPILSVRLQELFGMLTTPTVNNGKNSVVLHLLSPGYKPLQVTSDLNSFWSNTYQEVKKELKRRYPKHSWPENPFEAKAISGAVRKHTPTKS